MGAKVESVQTGRPRSMGQEGADDPLDRPWTSAIWKQPVSGSVWAGPEGLAGDAQVNRRVHGGPERALLLYSAHHYQAWQADWGGSRLGPGSFGENLTVAGLDELLVCVGDRYRVGEVRLEVSGPREPCNNLVRRHRRPSLIDEVITTGRAGWYARVEAPGSIEAGMEIVLLDRPFPQWPIARAAAVKRARAADPESAALLAQCPALLADWREKLGRLESERVS
ncbi:MAG: MOSC domain-containing protein [Gemmatimonadales bacterium]